MHLILALIYAVGNLQEFKNFKEFKNSVGYKLLCILSLPSSFTIRFLSQIQKYWIVIFWDKELEFFCFRNVSVAGTDEVFFGNFRGTAEDFSVPQPSFGPKSVSYSYSYSSSMEPTEVWAYSNIGSGRYHFPLISNRANFSTSIVYILAWACIITIETLHKN